jgi:transcription elongation GreA/GreB family factor
LPRPVRDRLPRARKRRSVEPFSARRIAGFRVCAGKTEVRAALPKAESEPMSVAFTREESAETAAAVELPDRPISPHLNLVTQSGLMALDAAMAAARAAYHTAQQIEDLNERRNAVAAASRDMRYFAERLRTVQLMPDPVEHDRVAFGSLVTFARDDGRRQTFRIVGEDEADPRAGSISYVSPVARALMGKAVAERVVLADHEIEVLAIE